MNKTLFLTRVVVSNTMVRFGQLHTFIFVNKIKFHFNVTFNFINKRPAAVVLLIFVRLIFIFKYSVICIF
jgi:hypothetical protein